MTAMYVDEERRYAAFTLALVAAPPIRFDRARECLCSSSRPLALHQTKISRACEVSETHLAPPTWLGVPSSKTSPAHPHHAPAQ